jgi:hypothetical protein
MIRLSQMVVRRSFSFKVVKMARSWLPRPPLLRLRLRTPAPMLLLQGVQGRP